MYLINILILTLISIASTEPPSFGNFHTNQNHGPNGPSGSGSFGSNDWALRPPTSLYGPPSHNPNNNNNNPWFIPTHRPHTSYGVPTYPNNYPNHNHGGYTYKPSSFLRVDGPKLQESTFNKPLFTPSSTFEYAASNGQIDNYNKALQEEAQQQIQQFQQQQQQLSQLQEQPQTAFANGFTGFSNLDTQQPQRQPQPQQAKSYVSVKFGQPNRHYNYQF